MMAGRDEKSIVVASRNRKKTAEIVELCAGHGIQVVGLSEFNDVPEVVEDGATFAENAAKKASQTALHLKRWVLGEDSGLAVDALGGQPGVYSARYASRNGPAASGRQPVANSRSPIADGDSAVDVDAANNQKLLDALSGVPEENRGAKYVCNVAVADPNGRIRLQVEACCRGRIAHEPRGTNGFGYDPLFLIPEYHRTFGELSPLVKRQLSHRARAFARLIPRLAKRLHAETASC